MHWKFYPVNLLFIGLILLPNIISVIFQPVNVPEQSVRPSWWTAVIVVEWIGRLGIFVLPMFWEIRFERSTVLFLMPVCMMIALYYAGWIRFFMRGRDFSLMFAPLFGIPVPMAVSPVLAVAFLGLAQNSWPVLAAAVIMALGHIPESIQNLHSAE